MSSVRDDTLEGDPPPPRKFEDVGLLNLLHVIICQKGCSLLYPSLPGGGTGPVSHFFLSFFSLFRLMVVVSSVE